MVRARQTRLNARALRSCRDHRAPALSSSHAATAADPNLLAEITATLAAGEDLRDVLDRFLPAVVALAGASGGAVRMLSGDGGRFDLVACAGLTPRVREGELAVSSQCGFCGSAAHDAAPVWSTDLTTCARRHEGDWFGHDCRGALAVPLQHKGRVLGVYNLFFAAAEQPAPAVAALLRSIGELLGLALDHLRLEAEHMRAGVMRERQRMAGEVHDALAQSLGFVKMRMPLLRDAIEAGERERALGYVEEVRETLSEAHSGLREIITHFRTRADAEGLAAGLERLAMRFEARTGIALAIANRLPDWRLPEPEEAELCHIVQEALANVERHAHARHGWLTVEPTAGGAEVRIEDDGVGLAQEAGPGHHGIAIMCERARRLGGELTLAPRPGGGSMVRLALPAARGEGQGEAG